MTSLLETSATTTRATSPLTKLAAVLLAITGAVMLYVKATNPDAETSGPADAKRAALAYDLAGTVRARSRDPGSVVFSFIGINAGATVACAKYGARNGFGGMVPASVIVVNRRPIEATPAAWAQHCQGLASYTRAAL